MTLQIIIILLYSFAANAIEWNPITLYKNYKAINAYRNNNLDAARDTFSQLIETERPDVIYNAGKVLYKQEEFDKAAAYFEQVTKSNGSQQLKKQAFFDRGNALAQSGQYQAAIDSYEEVLKIDPNHEQAKAMIEQLKKLLEQQKQQQQEQQKKEQEDKQQQEKQEQQNKEDNKQQQDQDTQKKSDDQDKQDKQDNQNKEDQDKSAQDKADSNENKDNDVNREQENDNNNKQEKNQPEQKQDSEQNKDENAEQKIEQSGKQKDNQSNQQQESESQPEKKDKQQPDKKPGGQQVQEKSSEQPNENGMQAVNQPKEPLTEQEAMLFSAIEKADAQNIKSLMKAQLHKEKTNHGQKNW